MNTKGFLTSYLSDFVALSIFIIVFFLVTLLFNGLKLNEVSIPAITISGVEEQYHRQQLSGMLVTPLPPDIATRLQFPKGVGNNRVKEIQKMFIDHSELYLRQDYGMFLAKLPIVIPDKEQARLLFEAVTLTLFSEQGIQGRILVSYSNAKNPSISEPFFFALSKKSLTPQLLIHDDFGIPPPDIPSPDLSKWILLPAPNELIVLIRLEDNP